MLIKIKSNQLLINILSNTQFINIISNRQANHEVLWYQRIIPLLSLLSLFMKLPPILLKLFLAMRICALFPILAFSVSHEVSTHLRFILFFGLLFGFGLFLMNEFAVSALSAKSSFVVLTNSTLPHLRKECLNVPPLANVYSLGGSAFEDIVQALLN